jgi:hypothetical protein
VLRLLAAQQALARLDRGDELLRARLWPAPDARLEQTIAFRDGRAVIDRALVRLDGGLGLQAELDPQLPKLLALLEAGNPVGAVVGEAAHELGEQAVPAALGSIRLLVEHGFLLAGEPAR